MNVSKRKSTGLQMQKQKSDVSGILHGLFIEHGKMKEIYESFDRVSVKIMEELAK